MPRARRCLLTTCGLPGAGKSTLVDELVEYLRAERDAGRSEVDVTVVRFDDIERELMKSRVDDGDGDGDGDGGGDGAAATTTTTAYDPNVWRAARMEAFDQIDALLSAPDDDEQERDAASASSSTSRHLVVADDNFYYASMRHRAHQLARRHRAAHVILHVECDLVVALRRNASRSGVAHVPKDAVRRMALAMEPPDGDKRAFERDAVATWAGGVAAVDASNPAAAVASTSGGDAAGGEWARKLRNDSWTHKDAIGKTAWARVDARWRDAAPEPDPDPAATEEARAALAAEGRAANAASTVHALDARTRRALSDALASRELSSLDGKQRGEFRRVRSYSHWSPYDRVGVVNADP